MTVYSEALFEEAAIIVDPGDYYGLPVEAQAILDALMVALGLDRDFVTMIAIKGPYIGAWWHTPGAEDEFLRILTPTDGDVATDVALGPMNRGDV